MAFHIRRQLRTAVVAALGGLPTTGANVFPGREWPTDPACFPGILVYARGGASAFESMGDTDAAVTLARDERLTIEGLVRVTGGEPAGALDDALDAIAAEVEPAMMTDPGIAALVERRELVETQLDGRLAGDARIGTIRLTYRIVYATAAGTPTAKV